MIKESLRPVSKSLSLFTRNCWLRTGSFILLLKVTLNEDEVASDSFCKIYRHTDFLYSRNGQYKIVDLHLKKKKKQYVEKYPVIDLSLIIEK